LATSCHLTTQANYITARRWTRKSSTTGKRSTFAAKCLPIDRDRTQSERLRFVGCVIWSQMGTSRREIKCEKSNGSNLFVWEMLRMGTELIFCFEWVRLIVAFNYNGPLGCWELV